MSLKRKQLLPKMHHLTQSEAAALLRRVVLEDALSAGWLSPCVRKPGGRAAVYYRTADVEDVSLRIASGEYPGEERGRA